jgi:hypothetical protein
LPASANQAVVGDHDQRVDRGLEAADAVVGVLRPLLALEAERLGDHADGERAAVAGDLGDHRRGAGAGAAAHAGGHEHHVGARDGVGDLLDRLLGRAAADVGVGAGAQALGERAAQADLVGREVRLERLAIGVGRDELDAVEVASDHRVDGVAAATTYADDQDLGVIDVVEFDEGHVISPVGKPI